MISLAISVEGRTEEEFVKQVLAPQLRRRGVESEPSLLNGDVRVPRLGGEMARLLQNHAYVTSFVDFYGFRDKGSRETPEELEGRIGSEVRRNTRQEYDPQRVFPYVQQYEFEGLLFSDVNAFADLPGVSSHSVALLRAVRDQFQTPEYINDNPDTAPSKGIADVLPGYRKVVNGPLIAETIGLCTIRTQCPRFSAWLSRVESLANAGHSSVQVPHRRG